MKLILTDTNEPARPHLAGFMYFWLKYVRGFDQTQHCARCLVGEFSPQIGKLLLTENIIHLERGAPAQFDYVYLCGVAAPYNWAHNFHLAFKRGADPLALVEAATYNGFKVTLQGAEPLPIPALPPGFQGLSKAFTTCRNFQFGVHYYGWQEK